MKDPALVYEIALTKVKNIGPIVAKQLRAHFGTAEAVLKAPAREIKALPIIKKNVLDDLYNTDHLDAAKKELAFYRKHGVKVLHQDNDDYPRRLKHFDNSPLILYYQGNADLNANRTVAIVGTRMPTAQGRVLTEHFVQDLQALGVTIISGLAFGIDGTAHKKCVELGINTVGVLGHGLDIIYPHQHKDLAKKMVTKGGLLTEFAIFSKPDRQNFPMRNRIIAGLADATIVMESKARGGSIITAEIANEYNKDVFAVPGSPNQEKSAGCNGLIKRTKAHLMENVDDLKYIMRWDDTEKVVQTSLFVELTPEEKNIIESIRHSKEIPIDALSYQHGKTSSQMSAILLKLEFKGLIRALPGKRYMLN